MIEPIERGKPISDERTLRDQLVAAGTAAAEEWLSKRANRRMSDVNRRRLAGHVVNALWQQIEQATVEIAGWVAEDDRAACDAAIVRAKQAEEARKASLAERDEWRRAFDAEHARAERAEAALAEFEHEVQWAHQVSSLDGTWAGDEVVQADKQAAHVSAGIVSRMTDPATHRVDVICRDVWTRATDWRKANAEGADDE